MKDSIASTWRHWRHGVRFYIAIAIIIVTLEGWWWASVSYGGSNLLAIRLEELYAWLSLSLLATAISIGPFYKLFKNAPGKSAMFDARRLLGIGAAWFASLHVAIVYASLFKLVNPLDLPSEYKMPFILGVLALIILLAMAFTSFDKAMKGLGVWWFRLHRFVYAAALLTLFHTLMIGVHALQTKVLIFLTVLSVSILVLEIAAVIKQKRKTSKWQYLATVPSIVLLGIILLYGLNKHNNPPLRIDSQVQAQ